MSRASSPRAPSQYKLAAMIAFLVIVMVFLAFVSGPKKIEGGYGQRVGESWHSVNGTGVLGKMFEEAGHTVFSWRMLSPRLRGRADCIVWFPDDFQPPEEDVRQWLEDWLTEAPDRTLICVGRDFDAAVWYWDTNAADAPEEQEKEIQRRKWEAKSDFITRAGALSQAEDCDWFTLKGGQKRRQVRSLEGKPEWLDGVDPSRLEIELNHRMVPSDGAEVLLESEGDVLISAETFGESRLIVVANGSFLLNLPLVNHEHRKLAGQLIDEVGPPEQTVVFLESGPMGLFPWDEDPTAGPPTGLEIFSVWPTNWILLHLAVVGSLFCFFRFPIFGLPRDPEPEGASDFGRHVEALGELLERSGDTAYAASRLAHYQQLTHPDSAVSRFEAARTGEN
ncbi:MAG: DUF4350 domain-containing protein [Planctomycetota bacterium]